MNREKLLDTHHGGGGELAGAKGSTKESHERYFYVRRFQNTNGRLIKVVT